MRIAWRVAMPIYKIELCQFPLLRQIPRPEIPQIWVEARNEAALQLLHQLPSQGLAVVGTRTPHPRALQMTRALLESLKGTSKIMISGLARGIDSTAHEAALIFGLPTIAVLGHGIHHTYPESSYALRESMISAGGLIVSEFEPDAEPRPYRFVQRNRLIAAWSQATCVMQAAYRSGALLTADYALQLDRLVFAAPHFPGERGFEGNQRLLDEFSVHSLWGAHSLGACWLELATIGKNFPQTSFLPEQNARSLKNPASSL
jgi:DNA protecting protein DprA